MSQLNQAVLLLEKLAIQSIQVRVEVEQGESRLKLRPSPPADLLALIRQHKAELLKELAKPKCPYCRRLLKDRKCWKCCICLCECGMVVSSAFISVCRRCEVAECRRLGQPY